MFVLDQSDSYFWPVSVELPANGSKKTFTFDAEFKRLPQDEVEDLRQRHANQLAKMRRWLSAMDGYSETEGESISEVGDETRELCDAVLCGWAKVADAKGEEVEFNDASKRQMYRVQGAAAAILNAWFDSLGQPSEKSAAKAGGFRAKN
jgi:hypothetical protein